jgi:hypothetical protein
LEPGAVYGTGSERELTVGWLLSSGAGSLVDVLQIQN